MLPGRFCAANVSKTWCENRPNPDARWAGFFLGAHSIVAGASGCTRGPLLIFYGIVMALPGLREIENERGFPGFLRQVGIPLFLAFATLAHAAWLQADYAQLPAVIKAMRASMLGVGLFSAVPIRLAVLAASRKS